MFWGGKILALGVLCTFLVFLVLHLDIKIRFCQPYLSLVYFNYIFLKFTRIPDL